MSVRAAIRVEPSEAAQSIARIEACDGAIGAWSYRDPSAASAACGVPIGIKDMIDVRGMPTSCGSKARGNAEPAAADATVVARLRAAGFIPIGKTVTTEFAFVDPAGTRNPYNLAHTPGGSSSGSAAAVASGMVPIALGTQTAGSLCRPAAYCGVAAIKPSYGLLPRTGMVPLSPSFDTIGVMARTVKQANDALGVMAAGGLDRYRRAKVIGRVACLPPHYYAASSADVRCFHHDTIGALERAGFLVSIIDPRIDFAATVADHRTVMLFEAYAAHGHLLSDAPHLLQPLFREGLRQGRSIEPEQAAAAGTRIALTRQIMWNALAGFDAIILQPAPTAAPYGHNTTGDQSYQTPWTAFHGPLVAVPGRLDGNGLPLSSMIGAAPGADSSAIMIADILQGLIDRLPPCAPCQADRRSVR